MRLQAVRHYRLFLGFAVIATLLLTPAVLSAQEIIAFQSQRDGNPEIYVTNVEGTNQRRLTFNTSFDGDPAFSLTGEKIAFSSYRDGNSEIYIMDADGSLQTNLTKNPEFDGHPTFSPDGQKIVFASNRGGHPGIWIMNVDGSNPTELAGGVGGSEPDFNTWGTKIVFSRMETSGADSDIWVMDADGSNPNNVSQDAGADDWEPSFSPDGTEIVFTKDVHDGAGSEIFVMNADGTNPINLTNIKSSDYHPTFNLVGNLITFTTLRDGNAEIYMMNADGSWPINITKSPGLDEMPVWGWKFNHPPVLSNIVVTSPINEGDTATLSGEITDPDETDTFTLDVNWGDGQSESFDYPEGTHTFELTHRYLDDPPAGAPFGDDYIITVTVHDHRNGVDSRGISMTVNNLNPIIIDAIVTPPGHAIVAGETITLFLNYTDPGYHGSPGDEDLRAFIQWGDGQGVVVATGRPEAISFTHQYTAVGNYSILIEVSDNDGGLTTTIQDVVVSAPPPPATPTNFRILSVGANQIQLAWTDASTTEDGFAIERCTGNGCNSFVEVGRVGPNTTTYLDGTVASNTQYSYRMRAFNTGGVSPYTNVVSAKTPRR